MTEKIKCPGDHLDSCTGCSKFRITRNGNMPSGNTCLFFLNKEKDRESTDPRSNNHTEEI